MTHLDVVLDIRNLTLSELMEALNSSLNVTSGK